MSSRKTEEDDGGGDGGMPFQPLSEDIITHVTGKSADRFAEVTDMEAIFTGVNEIRHMDKLVNLRSLCLIDSGLRRISGLEPLGRTLVRLVLTEQKLTTMEGLALPNLRDLQLHHNQITRIQGLDSCPRLQRLWLYDNRISVIENLEPVPGLRELWLQDNKIATLSGLAHLVNLQVLNLAGNRVSDLNEIHKVEALPALRSLLFYDVNFGDCPIVDLDGYRNYVVCNLPQLSQLDCDDVTSRERKSAHDAYMHKALKFAKRMQDLVSENEKELLAIEARRKRNWLSSGAMRGELLATFGELEVVVREGRTAVSQEQARQQHVRDANLVALADELELLRREQASWVDQRIAEERKAMALEELAFKAVIQRAEAEAEEAAHMAGLVYRTQGSVVCQELSEHSPDFRFLSSHVKEAMASQPIAAPARGSSDTKPKRRRPLRLLKAFKIFNRDLERRFLTSGDSAESMRLYLGGSRDHLRQVLERGRSSRGVDPDEPIALFTDPWHAAAYAAGRDPTEALLPEGRIHAVLQCRVAPGEVHVLRGAGATPPDSAAIRKACSRLPSGNSAACLTDGSGDDDDGDDLSRATCYVLPPREGDRVLPEFFMLAMEVGAQDIVRRLGASSNAARGIDSNEAALDIALADLARPLSDVASGAGTGAEGKPVALSNGVDAEAAAVLASYQAKVNAEVVRHEKRVWREMDPGTARELQRAEDEVRRLTGHLNSLREQIDAEKGLQERILREFRHQLGRGSGKSSRR